MSVNCVGVCCGLLAAVICAAVRVFLMLLIIWGLLIRSKMQ